MKRTIKPDLPGGIREYPPEDMITRNNILTTVSEVFERFGFEPLQTSTIHRLGTLADESNMRIFRVHAASGLKDSDSYQSNLALRFDLTVPLARFVAANPHLVKPFRRYELGTVYRGEKQQKGRYIEFQQLDLDIVGTDSMLADTEIIQVMYETMLALGINDFEIRINNRKILNGLAVLANFDIHDVQEEVFRILDKLEKIGWESIKSELQRRPENKYDTTAPNLAGKDIRTISKFLRLSSSRTRTVLKKLKKLFQNIPVGLEGVNELEEIVEYLKMLRLRRKNWKIDISIARGLGYYTGPVFETVIIGSEAMGAVFSGGRYDGLISRFSESILPATGSSFGVDRVYAILGSLDDVKKQKTLTQVMIASLGAEFTKEYLLLAKKIRKAGIKTQIYMGTDMAFRAQLAYALKLEIPFILFLGGDEKNKGIVQIKNTFTQSQEEVKLSKVVSYLKKSIKKLH